MEKVSFRLFCKYLGYGPHIKGKTMQSLAHLIGVDDSYLSKLYSANTITEKKGKAFDLVRAFMQKYNYDLDYIPLPPAETPQNNANIFNTTLQKEYNKLLNKYNKLKVEYIALKQIKHVSLDDYTKLKTDYNKLQTDYNNLVHLIVTLKKILCALESYGDKDA